MKTEKISFLSALLMNINLMIGSGIFVGPTQMALIAGSASYLTWPLVALCFLPIVWNIVELNRLFPGSGGFYTYASQGLGNTAGFLTAILYIIGYTFSASIELLAMPSALKILFGDYWFFRQTFLCVSAFLIICLIINNFAIKHVSKILGSLTLSKMVPLMTLIVVLPFIFKGYWGTYKEILAVPSALPMAIFGYCGFEYCCNMSHLIKNGKINGPKATILGFAFTALVYTLFHLGLIQLMNPLVLSQEGVAAFANHLPYLSPIIVMILSKIISLATVLTLLAGTIGMININSILMHSLAQDNLFIGSQIFNKKNIFARPWVAILTQGFCIGLIAFLIPNMWIVGSLCNICILGSFLAPLLSLLIMKYKNKQSQLSLLLTICALLIAFGLVIYSWQRLDSSLYNRVMYMLPILILLIVALFLQRKEKSVEASSDLVIADADVILKK